MKRFAKAHLAALLWSSAASVAAQTENDWTYATTSGYVFMKISKTDNRYVISRGDVSIQSPECTERKYRVCMLSDVFDIALPEESVANGDAWSFGRSRFLVISEGHDLKILGRSVKDVHEIKVIFRPTLLGYTPKDPPLPREYRLMYSSTDGLVSIAQIDNGAISFEAIASDDTFLGAAAN